MRRRVPLRRAALAAVALLAVVATATGCIAETDASRNGQSPSSAPSDTALGADPSGAVEDTFDGPAGSKPNAAVWTIQTGGGGWGNKELQTYTEDAVSLDGDGHLVIEARIPKDGGSPTSGRITTQGHYSFTYGTLTARIRIPDGKGLLPAFWLLGDSISLVGWPKSGEIDVVETPASTTSTHHNLHGPTTAGNAWNVATGVRWPTPLSEDFHDYAIVKSPGTLQWLVDGKVVYTVTKSQLPARYEWVFDAPFHILFSLAVGGNWPGAPDKTTPAVAKMIIDWVRYEPLTNPTPAPSP